MDSFDRGHQDFGDAQAAEAGIGQEAAALWSAIAADHRALDERTARLRIMRLCQGDDEVA